MSAVVIVSRDEGGTWSWCCDDISHCRGGEDYGFGLPTHAAALDAACEHIRATQPRREPTVFERAMGATG